MNMQRKTLVFYLCAMLAYLKRFFEINDLNLTVSHHEEQDVKNILALQNWLERTRKEVTNKVLSIKRISEFLNFPILAQPTLKKI